MEYVEYLGSYADIPVDTIVTGYKEIYGKERVKSWIEEFEKTGGNSGRTL